MPGSKRIEAGPLRVMKTSNFMSDSDRSFRAIRVRSGLLPQVSIRSNPDRRIVMARWGPGQSGRNSAARDYEGLPCRLA
jgi:hypothetical protein